MVTALDWAGQEIREAGERLEKASDTEHSAVLKTSHAGLAKSIKDGTVTIEEIDSFLKQTPKQTPGVDPVLAVYLLDKKAWLLLRQGDHEDALRYYSQALEINEESPSTWAAKGAALLELQRIDEAFQAFQKAYSLRGHFGPQKQKYLKDLFWIWGAATFFLGLDAVLEQDLTGLQQRVKEFLDIQERAEEEGLGGIPGKVIFREPRGEEPGKISGEAERTLVLHIRETPELKGALEELELTIRLLSIKDPFDRWRAFTKEISKVWPKDVSAVDAIREQRDREWNR